MSFLQVYKTRNKENEELWTWRLEQKPATKYHSKQRAKVSQQKAPQRGKLKHVKTFKLIIDQNVNLIAKLSASFIWKLTIMLEIIAKI